MAKFSKTSDNIKYWSDKRGMSLKETALKSGLSENALYRYNQGIEPKIETLKLIAKTLDVDLSDLSKEYESGDKHVDLADDDVIMTFEGKEIPPEDVELMRRLLRGGQK